MNFYSIDYSKIGVVDKEINKLVGASNKLINKFSSIQKDQSGKTIQETVISELQKRSIELIQGANRGLQADSSSLPYAKQIEECIEHLQALSAKIHLLMVPKQLEGVMKELDPVLLKKDLGLEDKEKLNRGYLTLITLREQLQAFKDHPLLAPLLAQITEQLEIVNLKKESLLHVAKEGGAESEGGIGGHVKKVSSLPQGAVEEEGILPVALEERDISSLSVRESIPDKEALKASLYKKYSLQLPVLKQKLDAFLSKAKELSPEDMFSLAEISEDLVNLQMRLLDLLSTEINPKSKELDLQILKTLSQINQQLTKIKTTQINFSNEENYSKLAEQLTASQLALQPYLAKESLNLDEIDQLMTIRDQLTELEKKFFFLTKIEIRADGSLAKKIFESITKVNQEIAKINVKKFDMDYAKDISAHKIDAHGVSSVFQGFAKGDLRIPGVIQEGQEGSVVFDLVRGPLRVSPETSQVKKIFNLLLSDINSVKFVKRAGEFFVIVEGQAIALSSLINGVNFNHITLEPEDLVRYHALLETQLKYKPQVSDSDSHRPTEESFNKKDPEGVCAALSFPEKEAVNVYTGSAYDMINSFMRGLFDNAVKTNTQVAGLSEEARIDATLKEALIHTCVNVAALNKLLDFQKIGATGEADRYLFRGETSSCPEFVIEKRKEAVRKGGAVEMECGFMSTSYQQPNSSFFNASSKAGVVIENVKGKNVMPLSQFGTAEREILVPPTQIQWRYHKRISAPFGSEIDLFYAYPVSVPPEKPTRLNLEKAHLKASKDLAQLKKEKLEI